jgi:16S rRNA (guanine527-N7)-methyltransferase
MMNEVGNRGVDGIWDLAEEMGQRLDEEKRKLILLYLDILWKWNEKINLTGLKSKKAVAEELLLDSLAASVFFPERGRYLDVGSGAGFPAIPIKIAKPGLEAFLVDSNRKRVSFLKEVVRSLRLKEIMIIEGRIEECPKPLEPGTFDRVTARALAKIPTVIEWCAPMVSRGGSLLCFQGREGLEAIKDIQRQLEASHLEIETVFRYRIPTKEAQRHIIILKKT